MITNTVGSLKKNGVVIDEQPAIKEIVKLLMDQVKEAIMRALTLIPALGAIPASIEQIDQMIRLGNETFKSILEPTKKTIDKGAETVQELGEMVDKLSGRAEKTINKVSEIADGINEIKNTADRLRNPDTLAELTLGKEQAVG